MIGLSKVVIQSPRLRLVPLSSKYVPDIFTEFTAQIALYMTPLPASNISQTQEIVNAGIDCIKKGTDLGLVILDISTQEFLGMAGLHRLTTPTPELGIWIKASRHGQGLGREAITALKSWADQNLTYNYLIYPVDKRNIASCKIAESLGGTIEAQYQKTKANGDLLDEVEYRIFPDTKA